MHVRGVQQAFSRAHKTPSQQAQNHSQMGHIGQRYDQHATGLEQRAQFPQNLFCVAQMLQHIGTDHDIVLHVCKVLAHLLMLQIHHHQLAIVPLRQCGLIGVVGYSIHHKAALAGQMATQGAGARTHIQHDAGRWDQRQYS